MSMQSILSYRGRNPKRASSIERRNVILEAALELIKTDGIKGVRHRAVADLAKVPLSATTYYFKDIDQLVIDSFVYFSEKNLQFQQAAFSQALSSLDSGNNKLNDFKPAVKQILVEYVEQQIQDKDMRIIERSFVQYAARNSQLAVNVNKLRDYFVQNIRSILNKVDGEDVDINAQLIIATISYMEEKAMLGSKMSKDEISAIFEKLVNNILK